MDKLGAVAVTASLVWSGEVKCREVKPALALAALLQQSVSLQAAMKCKHV